MTPNDCDKWIAETLSNITTDPQYNGYFFDRIYYWRLEKSSCLTINRDKDWFKEQLPKLELMWNYVQYFRKNKDKLDILLNYIDSMKKKMNNKIMKTIADLYSEPKPKANGMISEQDAKKYELILNRIFNEIQENN